MKYRELKKHQEIELDIDATAFKGRGVGRVDGMAVFVPGTAPGDRVRVRIIRKKKSYCEGKLLELLKPSSRRRPPFCCHADVCGGCTWQHLPYPEQLKEKEAQVRDHIQRIAGLDPKLVQPIAGCDREVHYRNKMEYSFGTRRWLSDEEIGGDEYVDDSGFAAGLHAPGRFDKILDISECHLQPPPSYDILDFIRNYCLDNDISAYDSVADSGFFRNLVIRNAFYSDDLMVNFVTAREDPGTIRDLEQELRSSFPAVTTTVNNVNDQPNPTAVGRYEKILHGPGYITDYIGDYAFRIHANAFFQTNTRQAERLYSIVADFLEPRSDDHLLDLYCGVGSLSLFMSGQVRKVTGVEMVEVAIENARVNAEMNEVENAEFFLADVKDALKDAGFSDNGKPNCLIIDPPRAGLHPAVVKHLCSYPVERVVYVSCNPSTLARDLESLKEIYTVEEIQPVDMFPQTYHIEAVAKLRKESSA